MLKKTHLVLVVGCGLLLAGCSGQSIRPATIFADHMVLQRDIAAPVWGTAAPGEKVTVIFNGQKQAATAGADGKWMVKLDKMSAGGPYGMVIKGGGEIVIKDVYVGEVWVCSGQSNMDMTVARETRPWCGVNNEPNEVAAADYPLIRFFHVDVKMTDEPIADANGKWTVCSPKTVGGMSAAAYFFGRDLQKKINVPIGLVVTTFGASTAEAWTSRPALEGNKDLKFLLENYAKARADYDNDSKGARENYKKALAKWEEAAAKAKAEGSKAPRKPGAPKDPRQDQHSPCVLYNAMIAPLVPYAMRGAIWYQGESNSPTANVYEELMATLIRDWRGAWGQGDFPFLYVQLANYGTPQTMPQNGSPAEARKCEAQLHNLAIPNTGMAVAIDIGDAKNIHPKNKQDVGLRLALIAEAKVYGYDVVYSGPIYDRMEIKDANAVLHFKHVDGGLVANGDKLVGFAIAGEDKKFVWADARVEGDTIVVSSPDVAKPVAVRYGWDKNPIVSLYNKAWLPASPFRTDKW